MKIAFNGKIMDDDGEIDLVMSVSIVIPDTLRECGIEDLSTVRVLLPLKGGHIPHPVKYVGPRR